MSITYHIFRIDPDNAEEHQWGWRKIEQSAARRRFDKLGRLHKHRPICVLRIDRKEAWNTFIKQVPHNIRLAPFSSSSFRSSSCLLLTYTRTRCVCIYLLYLTFSSQTRFRPSRSLNYISCWLLWTRKVSHIAKCQTHTSSTPALQNFAHHTYSHGRIHQLTHGTHGTCRLGYRW